MSDQSQPVDVALARAMTIHDMLLELTRMEMAQRHEVDAQRGALRELSTGLAQLLHRWGERPHETWSYHSLEELLHLQDALRKAERAGTTALPIPVRTQLAEVEALVEERILDAEGLPADHPMLGGSLTVWGLSELLTPLPHWVHWIAERLPVQLQRVGAVKCAGTPCLDESTPCTVNEPLPRCWGRQPLSDMQLLEWLCRSLAHVLVYCRLIAQPQPRSDPPGALPLSLLAQLLVRGCGTAAVDPSLPHVDLRPLRAGVRFLLVDLEELRDTLRDGAEQMAALRPPHASCHREAVARMAQPLAELAVSAHNATVSIRHAVPGL